MNRNQTTSAKPTPAHRRGLLADRYLDEGDVTFSISINDPNMEG
jgi:hypothetical protein